MIQLKFEGRNPSLMRAGFHKKRDGSRFLKFLFWSQSLVNEGRFPQEQCEYLNTMENLSKSQSLVNEGRFPQLKS